MADDTKAAWKRRALRAEQRARLLEENLTALQSIDRRLIYKAADASVALQMIREALDWYDALTTETRAHD
jgi:hypothetical protein